VEQLLATLVGTAYVGVLAVVDVVGVGVGVGVLLVEEVLDVEDAGAVGVGLVVELAGAVVVGLPAGLLVGAGALDEVVGEAAGGVSAQPRTPSTETLEAGVSLATLAVRPTWPADPICALVESEDVSCQAGTAAPDSQARACSWTGEEPAAYPSTTSEPPAVAAAASVVGPARTVATPRRTRATVRARAPFGATRSVIAYRSPFGWRRRSSPYVTPAPALGRAGRAKVDCSCSSRWVAGWSVAEPDEPAASELTCPTPGVTLNFLLGDVL